MNILLTATMTCPACGSVQTEQMPPDIWVVLWTCARCGAIARPRPGDCCVYCSYSDTHCPSKQQEPG